MRNEVVEVFATEEEIQKHFEAEVRALHPMLRDSGPNEDRVPALPGSREVPALSPQKLVALNVLSPSQVDRICADQTNTKFLVEDFLPLNSMAIFAGESTIGKSPLLYQLGICVASGQPFLGMHCEQGRVLYFDMENSILDCQTMRNSMLQPLGLKEAPMDFLVVLEPRSDVDQLLDELRPRLVVIDSLRAFRPDVTEKNNKAGEWLKEIRNFSRKYGACFVIVHHLRKPSQDRVSATNLGSCKVVTWLEDMEGPRAFVNQTDVRVAIEEGDGKPAALRMKWAIRVRGIHLSSRLKDSSTVKMSLLDTAF